MFKSTCGMNMEKRILPLPDYRWFYDAITNNNTQFIEGVLNEVNVGYRTSVVNGYFKEQRKSNNTNSISVIEDSLQEIAV